MFRNRVLRCLVLAGLVMYCAGCADPQERLLWRQKQQLYQEIIQKASHIKPQQYPIKRQITQNTIIPFLQPSAATFKNYKTVIIVLGSKPIDKTTPTIDLVYRILKVSDLSKEYPDALIVMTGGMTLKEISEARMMGVIAWSRGMDTRKILLEEESRTTRENARYCAKILGERAFAQVFLISRKRHLARALAGFQEYPVFAHSKVVDCGIDQEQIIAQIQGVSDYLRNPELQQRVKMLQQE